MASLDERTLKSGEISYRVASCAPHPGIHASCWTSRWGPVFAGGELSALQVRDVLSEDEHPSIRVRRAWKRVVDPDTGHKTLALGLPKVVGAATRRLPSWHGTCRAPGGPE